MSQQPTPIERITAWTGSVASLVIHTLAFLACGLVGALEIAEWNIVLLILTTAVSLEADLRSVHKATAERFFHHTPVGELQVQELRSMEPELR